MEASRSSAYLAADPSAPAAGDTVAISGCGYDRPIVLYVAKPDGTVDAWAVGVFADGCISPVPLVFDQSGVYELDAYQAKNRRRMEWMAELSVTVA